MDLSIRIVTKKEEKFCSINGCNEKHNAKGLCRLHYEQMRRPVKGVVKHSISGFDTSVGKQQDGICSVCGPVLVTPNLWLKNGEIKFICSNRKNKRRRTQRHEGFTPEKEQELLNKQSNKCDICQVDFLERSGTGRDGKRIRYTTKDGVERWEYNYVIDHDHSCCPQGRSCVKCRRGLLCSSCNIGIGNLKDSTDLLRMAILYLEKYNHQVQVRDTNH